MHAICTRETAPAPGERSQGGGRRSCSVWPVAIPGYDAYITITGRDQMVRGRIVEVVIELDDGTIELVQADDIDILTVSPEY